MGHQRATVSADPAYSPEVDPAARRPERAPSHSTGSSPWSGNQSRLRSLANPQPANSLLQRKLAMGATNDPLEIEADRTADRILRMPEQSISAPSAISHAASPTLRRCSCGGTCDSCRHEDDKLRRKPSGPTTTAEAPGVVHEVLRSSGRPLDPATRAFMEPRFGQDFSGVRIHTGDRAAESARQVNALAYTVGQHVVFGAGAYGNHTNAQRKLLAHELTHTIQQSSRSGIAAESKTALQRQPAAGKEPDLPALSEVDPALSPRYIDNLYQGVTPPSLFNGASTFSWKEGAVKKTITIPMSDIEESDKLVFVALLKVHTTKEEALKTVQAYEKAGPGFKYYSFYTAKEGVIMPTIFSSASTPLYHAMWPDLIRMRAEDAADIAQGMQQFANAIDPFPCTEVDADGHLAISLGFFNCALPVLLHAHAIRSGRAAAGGRDPQAPKGTAPAAEVPPAERTRVNQGEGAKPEPAAHDTPTPKSEIDSFAQKNAIAPKQLAGEVAELTKEAGNPAKVHAPADPRSPNDAEIALSDGHEMHRDRKTHLWDRCSGKCKPGLGVDPEVNRKVDETLNESKAKQQRRDLIAERAKLAEKKKQLPPASVDQSKGKAPAPPRKAAPSAPVRTAKDVISSGTEPLAPGRSELGQYGIDRYSTFSNRPNDKFFGHELLENLWLEVKGYGKRLASPASRNNPAIALTHAEHTAVGREQRALGLFDRSKVAKMSAPEVIEQNAKAMTQAGIPDYVVETLKKEALAYAATLKPPAGARP